MNVNDKGNTENLKAAAFIQKVRYTPLANLEVCYPGVPLFFLAASQIVHTVGYYGSL